MRKIVIFQKMSKMAVFIVKCQKSPTSENLKIAAFNKMSKMAVFALFHKTKIVVDNDLHAKSENKIEFSKMFVSRIGNK